MVRQIRLLGGVKRLPPGFAPPREGESCKAILASGQDMDCPTKIVEILRLIAMKGGWKVKQVLRSIWVSEPPPPDSPAFILGLALVVYLVDRARSKRRNGVKRRAASKSCGKAARQKQARKKPIHAPKKKKGK